MRVAAVIVTLVLCAAGPVGAQVPQSSAPAEPDAATAALLAFNRDCMDEYGRNLCEATTRARILSALGLTPAEALAPAREPQLRVFMIDGYSSDQPAFIMTGLAGHQPRLEVYSRAAGPNDGRPAFSLALTDAEALKATALIEAVRRAPVVFVAPKPVAPPTPPGAVPPPPPPPCLHAWTTWIEVIDGAGVTRRIRNACQEDALFGMASGFGEIALARLPQCQVLRGPGYRNEHDLIDGCATLAGEMAAAAAVRRVVDDWGFQTWDGTPNPDLLADVVSLRLPGREAVGRGPVFAALRDLRGFQVSNRIRGLSASEVTVTGAIVRREQVNGVGHAYFAPLTQRWTSQRGEWRLSAMEVGAFAPPARPDQELLGLYGPGD